MFYKWLLKRNMKDLDNEQTKLRKQFPSPDWSEFEDLYSRRLAMIDATHSQSVWLYIIFVSISLLVAGLLTNIFT